MARARKPLPGLVKASAPCRVDCGGTLDLDPFSLSLNPLGPATFNLALDLPTRVEARSGAGGVRKVVSSGFAVQEAGEGEEVDYGGPLGFFFLAMDYFGLRDCVLTIRSDSPPRSALGGSSAAILASVAALARLAGRRLSRLEAVNLAHLIESALFQVPCGRQDHLAAAYGGVHLWTWSPGSKRGHSGRKLLKGQAYPRLEKRLLVAFPGQTHSSADVNGVWTRGFISGRHREAWRRTARLTQDLAKAVARGDWRAAARALGEETGVRLELTPEVLPPLARRLYEAARELGAGARFSGAGGGGCVWALGPRARIEELKPVWEALLAGVPEARLLPSRIDRQGLRLKAKAGSEA